MCLDLGLQLYLIKGESVLIKLPKLLVKLATMLSFDLNDLRFDSFHRFWGLIEK